MSEERPTYRELEKKLAEANKALAALRRGGIDAIIGEKAALLENLRETKEKLRESEEQIRATLNALPDLLFEVDRHGRIYDCFSGDPNLLYTAPKDFIDKIVSEILPRDASDIIMEAIGEAAEAGRHQGATYPLEMPSGTRWFELSISAKGSPNASGGRLIALVRDITDRKRAEEALRQSEEKFRNMSASAQDAVIMMDSDGNISYWNEAAERIFGFTNEEVMGRELHTFLGPRRYHEAYRKGMPEFKETGTGFAMGKTIELAAMSKDGTEFPIELSLSSVKIKGKWNAIGILRDVSERKIMEEAIVRKSKVLFGINQVFEKELNCRTEEELAIQCLSEAKKLTGSQFGWIGQVNPEGRFDSMAMSDPGWDACRMLESKAPLLIRNMEIRGYWGRVIKEGESQIVNDPASHPDRVGTPEGHPPITSFLGVPLKEAGKAFGMIGLANREAGYGTADQQDMEALSVAFVEVLRRKRGERMLRESKEHYQQLANANMQLLEQARRDGETKATLLREVNHRVKNNLSAIIGMLYAEKKFARSKDQDAYNFITKKLVDRLHGLSTTHSLLSASEWAPLSLSELAAQVIHRALQTLPGDKQVSVEVAPSTSHVASEQAHHLALVINELAINTIKHTLKERDAAHITVRITPEDGAVGFEYRDDGPGYPEDVLRFERHRVGFDLIRNIVRKGLRGKLSLHNDEGAVTVIRFKSSEQKDG